MEPHILGMPNRILHAASWPLPLESYQDAALGLGDRLIHRVEVDPFNIVALGIFLCAIVHTFLAGKIQGWANRLERRNTAEGARRGVAVRLLHGLGEVELVFAVWAGALAVAGLVVKGRDAVTGYVLHGVSYSEPLFVLVVMAIAGTRPVLALAERVMRIVAGVGGRTPAAWWLTVLMVAPLLGSLITEPAAMTIGALLLGAQFYALKPGTRLRYATLGLLFVNVSVGGVLTHFAAPPVIMVAQGWQWNTTFMFLQFGWRAIAGILVATLGYYFVFRRELRALRRVDEVAKPTATIPAWLTIVQVAFLAFTVWQAHHPRVVLGTFIVFLGFAWMTSRYQGRLELRSPILVGIFLAGLVIHGGLQAWWIEPVLGQLTPLPLFLGATVLTAFNDNAAITYLASLVPGFTDVAKYRVVAGAVTGGGLTVIANAPNPAGQSLLAKHFPEGVSPLKLMLGALFPTAVMIGAFLVGA